MLHLKFFHLIDKKRWFSIYCIQTHNHVWCIMGCTLFGEPFSTRLRDYRVFGLYWRLSGSILFILFLVDESWLVNAHRICNSTLLKCSHCSHPFVQASKGCTSPGHFNKTRAAIATNLVVVTDSSKNQKPTFKRQCKIGLILLFLAQSYPGFITN